MKVKSLCGEKWLNVPGGAGWASSTVAGWKKGWVNGWRPWADSASRLWRWWEVQVMMEWVYMHVCVGGYILVSLGVWTRMVKSSASLMEWSEQASGEGIHPKFSRVRWDNSVSRVWRTELMAGGAVGDRVWTGEKFTPWCVPSAGSHYRANVVLWSPTHTDFAEPG